MSPRLERLFARWTPPHLPPEDAVRGRFFVGAHFSGLVVVVISLFVYSLNGMWGQIAFTAVMGVASIIALLWYRRTAVLYGPTILSLLAATFMFAGATLAQTPSDVTNVCFLSVIPLLAAFTLGQREALRWVVLEGVVGAIVIWLGTHGYTMPFVDEAPWITQSINFLFMLGLLWLFSTAYHAVSTEAYRELQQAHQAKSTFLATISHEIRTPMNGVLGLTEVMLAEETTPAQRDNLKLIQRSGKLLVALINDLLDITKVEAGKLTIERYDFGLRNVLDDVRGLFEPVAKKKGLVLEVQLDERTPTALRGDGMRLTQVLNNLVSNAVKFTNTGTIVLRAKPGDGPHSVVFEVEDTGIGIAPALAPKLFTAFAQADGSTTRRHGGSGLGLVLAQQLVGVMGGKITVASTPGRGSRFSFVLSFSPQHGPLELTPPVGTPIRDLAGPLVLVVDDNPINLTVAAQLVEKAGYRALKASSGKEALTTAGAFELGLVLMDCHMPEMDGFETTTRIRALSGRRGQVPIVALTASAAPEDIAACHRSGMNDVLAKPVTLRVLVAMLERYFRPPAS